MYVRNICIAYIYICKLIVHLRLRLLLDHALLQGGDGPPREAACHIWPVHKVSPHITLTTHHPNNTSPSPCHPHITPTSPSHHIILSMSPFVILTCNILYLMEWVTTFQSATPIYYAYMCTCTLLTISKIHQHGLSACGHQMKSHHII